MMSTFDVFETRFMIPELDWLKMSANRLRSPQINIFFFGLENDCNGPAK